MNATRTESPAHPPAVLPLSYASVPRPVVRRSRVVLTIALLVAFWPVVAFAALLTWAIVRAAFR
jgi:hypothetical protein